MIDIKRILCPIDYSDGSRRALDHAVAIARWYGATVSVFHVNSILPAAAYSPAGPVLPPALLVQQDTAATIANMQRFAATEAAPTVAMTFDVADGSPATEILARATAMKSDLLVLGTHGLSGFDRLVLGSVTEKVLRKAACPVLTVPAHAPDAVPPAPLFRHMLCPVDFSDCSLRALTYAIALAQEADAHLTVLNVVELPPGTAADLDEAVELPRDLRHYIDDVDNDRRARLKAVVPDAAQAYCTIDTMLVRGKPYREILRVAATQTTDLIVMGVHGRGVVDLLLFGSTTQHIVRQATCPVLTLRAS